MRYFFFFIFFVDLIEEIFFIIGKGEWGRGFNFIKLIFCIYIVNKGGEIFK